MANCSICNREVDGEKAAVLTLGALGTSKYLCEECEADFETATRSTDVEKIALSMEKIGKLMADNNAVGNLVLNTVNDIFDSARERALEIKNGTYDFSKDEPVEIATVCEDVPEELLESEEDRALDEAEEIRNQKIDKIITWISSVIFGGALVWVVYSLITKWF